MLKARNLKTCVSLRDSIHIWLDGLVDMVLSCKMGDRGSIPELTVLFSLR